MDVLTAVVLGLDGLVSVVRIADTFVTEPKVKAVLKDIETTCVEFLGVLGQHTAVASAAQASPVKDPATAH